MPHCCWFANRFSLFLPVLYEDIVLQFRTCFDDSLQEDVGLYVVDGILEEIRVGMEVKLSPDRDIYRLFRYIA